MTEQEAAIREKYIKILQNDWTISYKTLFAWIEIDSKRLGAAGAVYLSQMHFWRGVYGRPFHKTWWELQLETGLNREEQKTAKKRCGSLIKTYLRKPIGKNGKRQDAPVTHYDVDYRLLATLLPGAAQEVEQFALKNDRLGKFTQSEWGDSPTPIGATAPRSKADSTANSTTDSTFPASAASPKDPESSLSPRPPSDTDTELPTAPKRSVRGGAPHPDHARLMAVFHGLHLEAFGEKPAFGPRDGAALKAMLAAHGPEAVEQKARALARVSKDAKPGYWKCAILPSVLQSRWNAPELVVAAAPKQDLYAAHRAKHLENQRKLGVVV